MRRAHAPARREPSTRRTTRGFDPGLPIRNYDEQPVAKIQQRLSRLSPADQKKLRDYEHRHKDRATLLRRTEREQDEQRASQRAHTSDGHTASGARPSRDRRPSRARPRSNGAGSSHTTTDDDAIRHWADARGARPMTVRGTASDGAAGVLRLSFRRRGASGRLDPISWDEFFEKFDRKKLQFLYQDQRSNGEPSNFFRLIVPRSAR